MSTSSTETTTSPGRELAARARHVAGLLHQLADAAESSQPETVGSWMRHVREIHANVRDELMTAAVACERAGGASWTAIGAAQDPPVSRQAAQQRYQRLVRRTDVTSDGDTVAEPTPEPARHEEPSVLVVNDDVDRLSQRCTQRQVEPSRTAVSAGGMWAADDRHDLIRASDYLTSGAWLVTVEGVAVGSVQPTYSGARAKRWTALINGMSIFGGKALTSRNKAAIQVLMEHKRRQDRAAHEGLRKGP
ncbi:MAG: hypothetical protein ACRD1G_17935 [Acidimicrobiales bacterium]